MTSEWYMDADRRPALIPFVQHGCITGARDGAEFFITFDGVVVADEASSQGDSNTEEVVSTALFYIL